MKNPCAALLIIGNEILSGRTLDTNTNYIAKNLTEVGIDLMEVRTVPDIKETVIEAVLALSQKYDYLITTGGIGPTHDDITSLAVAEAFGLPYNCNKEIYNILEKFYHDRGDEMNSARAKMAYIPEGSILIGNEISKVPGFAVGNVFCLAGVPDIMQSMLHNLLPMLKKGKVVKSLSHTIMVGESKVAVEFEALQRKYPDIDMGSYPFVKDGQHGTSLVLRSNNYEALEQAFSELKEKIAE